jgi:hypothetical protein
MLTHHVKSMVISISKANGTICLLFLMYRTKREYQFATFSNGISDYTKAILSFKKSILWNPLS